MDLNVTHSAVTPTVVDAANTQPAAQQTLNTKNVSASTETVSKQQHIGNSNIEQTPAAEPLVEDEAEQALSPEEIEEVTTKLSDMMAILRKGLTFTVDETSGTQVVSVLDIDTGELIRQIPNEEALELAIKLHEKMEEMDGLLMSTQA
ncbi:flagellar protein FlaG [Shewanella youngdeokensis]|uniref:Flagellar protein FlaG n=1 Tax=Shewanella youngdeokensis TaxID=2999068 RepID=A0ABZ0K119_9GAMM|nr:flagellar protein FlaG [Shewanella sp. DAU334]